ncbi:agmatine deiminase family protein [Leisingera aquaemixtae]|uniref:Agmatine deiminase family protein n=1 Tax=Leisingera aquaemixtae TaxID=1396826 RepID=A0ABY5WJE6_9RHOB|nr:agmatine deiminase family protein [Leisingera aquaemixtae]UWQ41596.1 agmatine deiminase family protein [Leisingera aquaemixtae]
MTMHISTDLTAALASGKSPGEQGFVMPIETAPHAACWMAWPWDNHEDNWGAGLAAAQENFVRVATAISCFEPVRVVAHPDHAALARSLLPPQVDVVPLQQGDHWFRDTGPLFVKDGKGQIIGSSLIFNCWGEKFPDYELDAGIGAELVRHLGLPLFQSPLTGEGGGLHVDGRGTVITTETCFLNPNRNPGMTKADVERELYHAIGARKVIWLPGDEEEWITDGHIDGMLTFAAPGKLLFERNPDPANPRHRVCGENLKALRGQTDADGREIEIGLIDEAYMVEPETETTALSYVNAYIANGGVVIPSFDTPTDAAAREIFAKAFPGLKVLQVDMRGICHAGGGIHCMTQQQPA